MKKILVVLLGLFILSISILPIKATLGVGIATGTITIDEKLMSGMSYTLPSLTIMNTGDETATYGVNVAYHDDQKEHLLPNDWLTFSPSNFLIEPGKSQVVEVRLDIPLTDVIPGDYFCYLEGSPKKDANSGETSVGIAAATKLYLTIAPSNIFQAIYYKTLSIWETFYPWSLIVLIAITLIIIVTVFKKLFNFELNIKRKEKKGND